METKIEYRPFDYLRSHYFFRPCRDLCREKLEDEPGKLDRRGAEIRDHIDLAAHGRRDLYHVHFSGSKRVGLFQRSPLFLYTHLWGSGLHPFFFHSMTPFPVLKYISFLGTIYNIRFKIA